MIETIIILCVGFKTAIQCLFNPNGVATEVFAPTRVNRSIVRHEITSANEVKEVRKLEQVRIVRLRLAKKYNVPATMDDDTFEYYHELDKFEQKDKREKRLANIKHKMVTEALKAGKLPPGILLRAGKR